MTPDALAHGLQVFGGPVTEFWEGRQTGRMVVQGLFQISTTPVFTNALSRSKSSAMRSIHTPKQMPSRRLTLRGLRRLYVGVACLLAAALAGPVPVHAAVPAGTPLPESEYSVRALCGPVAPGYAQCFALQLVPKTAAAAAHARPLAMTRNHAIVAAEAAEGAYGLRPQDLHGAYGLPTDAPLPQTIGIVDAYDDPTAEADLAVYSQEFGLPSCTKANGCFRKVSQDGNESPLPATEGKWAGEIALDIETAHAICENCHILLVEADSPSDTDLEAAEETAVRLGATEISNSYGGPESETDGAAYNHPGIPITASTGDYGYLNWDTTSFGLSGHPNYPASSPHVVAAGGTRLDMHEGAWTGETVWNDGSTMNTGFGAGGSGCSEHFEAQPWQKAVADWASVGCGEKRAAADVAADGDPYTGVAVYDSTPESLGEAEPWKTVGGTSLSSPIIAATFALAGGSGGVSYPAETLYEHLGQTSLHDITEGSNGLCAKAFDAEAGTSGCTTAEEAKECETKPLICSAGSGYDGPSGVGTPDGLAAFTPPQPVVTALSPPEGDPNTTITITGEHLRGVVAVEFGAAKATSVIEDSATELTVRSPEHSAGVVDVTVTTAGGTSTTSSAGRFTYLAHSPYPTITSITPGEGATTGGATVKIDGEHLTDATAVSFGATAASSFEVKSDSEIQAISPAHGAGSVDITVTTSTATSASLPGDTFTYKLAPTLGSPAPSISGDAVEGATLTAETGVWNDEPASYSYTWLRCNANGQQCDEAIPDATGSTHKLTGEDLGHALAVEVTASNAGGAGHATSAATTAVLAKPSLAWTGARAIGSGTYDWSEEGDWSTAAPGTSVGTLSFPSLAGNPACASQPRTAYCYESANDIPEMEVEKISIYDKAPYRIPGYGITLGSGGIEARSTGEVELTPEFVFPITLSAPQTWSISGGSSGYGGLGIDKNVSGEGHNLDVELEEHGGLCLCAKVNDEVGEVTIKGADTAHAGDEAIDNGSLSLGFAGDPAELDATDGNPVRVEDAMLAGTGSTGPLTVTGGYLVPGDDLAPNAGSLTVDGSLALDSHTSVQLMVRASGTTAGVDYPQINATGDVNLGNAQLTILPSAYPTCPTPPLGSSYTIVTTTGQLEGAFQGIPAGKAIELPCTSGVPPTLKFEYTAHAVIAKVVEHLPSASSKPTVSGKTVEGSTLTAGPGVWEHSPSSYSYKWLRCTSIGSSCTAIANAEAETYVLSAADVGHAIEVEVVAANSTGPGTASSSPTAEIAAKLKSKSSPQISGVPVEGETLTTSVGSWEGGPTSFAHQWVRCDEAGASCTAIAGATGFSYQLTSEDVGHTIRLEETVTNSADEAAVTSAATATVVPRPPHELSPPTISGEAHEGQLLTAAAGTWEPPGTLTFAYRWLRCESGGGSCLGITGGNASSYTLTAEDVGHELRVEVTAENAGGSNEAMSAATAVVTGASVTHEEPPTTTTHEEPPTTTTTGTTGTTATGGGGSQTGGGGSSGSSGSGGGGHAASSLTAGTAQAGASATVKAGTAEIKLTCTGAGPCAGELKLLVKVTQKRTVTQHGHRKTISRTSETTIATAGFSLPAGASETLRVALDAKAKALLRNAGDAGLRAKLEGKGIAAGTLMLKEAPQNKAKQSRHRSLIIPRAQSTG